MEAFDEDPQVEAHPPVHKYRAAFMQGYRTQQSRRNDGYVDHLARRGVEAATTGVGWVAFILLICIVLAAFGVR